MSVRDTAPEKLDRFGRKEDEQGEPPNNWESESPAESQSLRWENGDEVLWIESETDSGSPYAIFYTGSSDEVADVVEKGFENLDEAEVDAVKIMEELEQEKGL